MWSIVRSKTVDYHMNEVVEILEQLTYSRDIKTTITRDFARTTTPLRVNDYVGNEENIERAINAGFDRDDVARLILRNTPSWELSIYGREYFEEIGISPDVLDEYNMKFE